MVRRALIAALVLIAGSALPASVQARPAASQFTVNVTVTPARTVEGATVTLQAHTRIGSMCAATVLYDDGRHSPRLAHAEQQVGQSGIVRWRWHVATASRGGAASVICIFKGQVRLGAARFTVTRSPRAAVGGIPNLALGDLPRGFVRTKDRTWTAPPSARARPEALSASTKRGLLVVNTVVFVRRTTHGMARIESALVTYASTEEARAGLMEVATGAVPGAKAAMGVVGAPRLVWTETRVSSGVSTTVDAVAFQRGRYVAVMYFYGPTNSFSAAQAMSLATIVDNRLRHAH